MYQTNCEKKKKKTCMHGERRSENTRIVKAP